ncbi:ATPase [Vibrio cholerae]|uniref:hypothetical protein n=1 Tax=Vibrio cholerae TaxID=666 RepID=UPI0011DB81EE|nr:hypothetical protein [Vibrio cholerae]TXY57639.1 hypothetical protein FXE91_10795 [Vibrio cholerae]GHX89552.1 ATPase [Vibrio cholerae]
MSKAFKVIQAMGGNDAIVIHKPFMEFCRNYNQAAVLSQLVFWSGTKPNGEWFYKSHAELGAETYLTFDQVRGALAKLKEKLGGAMEVKMKKANGTPTPHYKFNQEALINLIFPCEVLPDMKVVNSPVPSGENPSSNWGNDQFLGSGENPSSITDHNHINTTDLKTTKKEKSKKKELISKEQIKSIWNESVSGSANPEQAQIVRVVPEKSLKDIAKTYMLYQEIKSSDNQEALHVSEWIGNYFHAVLKFRSSMSSSDGTFNWKINLEYACRPATYEKVLNWGANQ